jgi:hypothetical protein
LEDLATLLVREQSRHGRDLAHLDRVPIEARQDSVQPGEVTALDQLAPPLEVALMRLARHSVPEAFQVVLDSGSPLVEAVPVEECGESAMQLP